MVKDEENEEISEELDKLFDESKKVVKVKSYWNENMPEGKISRAPLDETSQIRLRMLQKVHGPVGVRDLWAKCFKKSTCGPGRDHPLRAVKGRITVVKRRRGMTQVRRPLKSEKRLRVVREEVPTWQEK